MSATTQIASIPLRPGISRVSERLVIDRTWDRPARKHRFEVLIMNQSGAIVVDTVIDTLDKDKALAAFLEIAAEWGLNTTDTNTKTLEAQGANSQ